MKNFTKSYEINMIIMIKLMEHLKNTESIIENTMKKELEIMKGFKFIITFKITFSKKLMKKDEKTGKHTEVEIRKVAYFNSKTKLIINEGEINSNLKIANLEIINSISVWLSEGSGWVIDEINNHYLNLIKYKPLKGGSYLKLPTELQNPNKALVNIQNKDNECFRWCHIRLLNPQKKIHRE